MEKVEFEISRVQKEMLKISYPSWDESYNSSRQEQLKLFASLLDDKLDACIQKLNMLKGYHKGKAIAHESHKVDKHISTPHLASNPSNCFNLMQNMPQAEIYPPLINISDETHSRFWRLQLGQSSQPCSMVSSAQRSYPVVSEEGRYAQSYSSKYIGGNLINQADSNAIYDPKIGTKKKDRAENDESLSPHYYNGNAMTMRSYPIAMHTVPFNNLPSLSHGFQSNGFYDMHILQVHMFNYMNGRK